MYVYFLVSSTFVTDCKKTTILVKFCFENVVYVCVGFFSGLNALLPAFIFPALRHTKDLPVSKSPMSSEQMLHGIEPISSSLEELEDSVWYGQNPL